MILMISAILRLVIGCDIPSSVDQFDVIMIKHQTLSNFMIIVVLINIEHTYIAYQFACNYDHHQHYQN